MPDLVKKWKEKHPYLQALEGEIQADEVRKWYQDEQQRQRQEEQQRRESQFQAERNREIADMIRESSPLAQEKEAQRQRVDAARGAYRSTIGEEKTGRGRRFQTMLDIPTPTGGETKGDKKSAVDLLAARREPSPGSAHHSLDTTERTAAKEAGRARADTFGSKLALGYALMAKGQNPFGDQIPELQKNIDSALKDVKRAEKRQTAAETQHRDIASRYQRQLEQQQYGSLRFNTDFRELSHPDEETAKRGANSPTKNLGEYYQIYHRKDVYDPDKPANEQALYQDTELRYLTDNEADTYFYLWNKEGQGPRAAHAYLETIRYKLNERRQKERQEYLSGYARENPGAASVASVAMNAGSIIGVLDLTMQNIRRALGDRRPVDYNSSWQDLGRDAAKIREYVAGKIAEENPGAADLATFLYMTGMSIADSVPQTLAAMLGAPPALTTAMLGMQSGSAALQAVYDAKDRGASDGQALIYGYAAGIAEYAFEKISLDTFVESFVSKNGMSFGEKLFNKTFDDKFRNFVMKLGKNITDIGVQGGVEASEEAFTTLANTITDLMINRDKSELLQSIQTKIRDARAMNPKADPTEIEKQAITLALKEWVTSLGADALGGLVSGGFYGVAGAGFRGAMNKIGSAVGNVVADAQTAREMTDVQNREAAAAREQALRTAYEQTQNRETAEPVQPRQQTAREQNPLQYALDKAANGETLTKNDARAILEDEQAMQTLRDAGVLNESVRNDSEGRGQVLQAVEALAEQNRAETTQAPAENVQETPERAEKAAPAQERTGPPLPSGMQQNTETGTAAEPAQAGPPLPSRMTQEQGARAETPAAQETAQGASEGLRLPSRAEAAESKPTPRANLTIGGRNVTLNENRQEADNGRKTEAADAERFRAEARRNAAGRQADGGGQWSTGVARLLDDVRNYRTVRDLRGRADQAASLQNQADARNLRYVSGKELGVEGASDAATARILDNDMLGREWEQTVNEYAAKGVTLRAMTGQIETTDLRANGLPVTVRAWVSGDGKNIIVQADHPSLSWQQLLAHEELHRRIKGDDAYRRSVQDALLEDEKLKPYLSRILDRYTEAYRAVKPGITDAEIVEELLADYRAGFDMLDPLGLQDRNTAKAAKAAARDIREVERKAEKSGENQHGQPTTYSEDGTKATVDDVAVAANVVDEITEDPRPFDYMSAGSASIETYPDWAKNFYQKGGENAQQIIDAVRQFTEAMIASDVIMDYVPTGSVAYNKTGPLRKNVEYVFSFDMDASCPRTFQFLNYRNELQRIAGRPLTYAESIQLIELMRAYGQQIPCSYCYVENKRVLLANNYLNWFNFYDKVVGAETGEEARKLMYGYNEKKDSLSAGAESELARWRKADKNYRPKASEVWLARQTAKNSVFNWLDQRNEAGLLSRKTGKSKIVDSVCKEFKITDKAARAEITDFVGNWIYDRDMKIPHNYEIVNDTDISEVDQRALNMHRTAMAYANSASSARTVDNYMPYTDQVWNVTPEQKRRIMAQGGIRKHSSNDFRMDYVQDYFMFFADLAAGGWTGHTYTKNVDYVKIFGRTGDRINVSVAFTDENGQVKENMQEGMGWKDAQQLRKDYEENVGVMAMVTSDAQLSYALNSDWIDMIIPFHASGLDKSVWYNIRMWQDYTSKQNERWYTKGRMEAELKDAGVTVPKDASSQEITELYRKTFDIKMITNKDGLPVKPHFLPGSYEVNGQTVPGHNNDKEKYFKLCKEYGVTPRFQGILVDDGEGNMIDVTEHRNYMKLIKETARAEVEQKPIQFNFDQVDPALGMTPFEYAMQRMQEEARNGGYANTAEDKFGIVKEFQEEYLGKNIPLPTGLDEKGKPLPGNLTDLLTDRAIAFREGLMEMQNKAAQEQAQVVEESQQEGKASIEIDPEVAAQFSPQAIAEREARRSGRTGGKKKVSKVRTNTYAESGLFNEVEAQMDEADPSNYEYDPISEKRSMNEARSRLKADFDGEVSKLSEPDYDWGGSDLDTAMGILHRYRTEGRATGDYTDFWNWSKTIQKKGTKGGQFIQAFAKYTRTGTGTAAKAAAKIHEQNQLTPAQQKQIKGHVERLMNGMDTEGAAGDAVKQAKGQKEPTKKQDGKVDKKKLDAEAKRRKDAERLIREMYRIFNQKQQNHGERVEDWLKLTGEELAKKIASRFDEKATPQKTTMQIILSDLVGFAEEHALPERQKAETEKRTAIDIITDYLNNRDAYGAAWAEAQGVLRSQYADDQEKLDALDGFLGATIAYNAEGTDRTMLDAILQSADVLGISEKRIKELASAGATNSTIDRIGDELVSQVKERMGADWQEEYGQQLKDAVRRHITGIALSESASEQALRLGKLETAAAKELDINLQKILTESRLTKQDASRRVADYLIRELGIPSSDAAIAAQRISESFMDELAARADKRLGQMFGEKTTKAREQRDKLLDLLRLGGFTNANVEDAVVDALGIGKLSREEQKRITGDMARFGETLDAIMDDDLEGLRQLIREQAAVRNTPLSRQAEKTLAGETDAEYLRDFAMAQLASIAGDYAELSPGAKISTFQTISHLLNARTALRNFTSNQVFDLVDSAANNLATIPDIVIGAMTGKRTVGVNKSWLSEMKRAGAKQGAARNALEVRLDVSPDDRQKSKYGTAGRRTNSMANSNAFGRILSHLEEVMGYELNTTDEFHKGSVRGETLESLARFVERGDITQEQANAWAEEEALYRSFQDDTLVGGMLGSIKELLNIVGFGDSGKKNTRGRTIHDFGLGDLVVKYTQVPGALIHRGIEYSPLGYAKMLYDLAIAKDSLVRTQKRGEDVANAQRKLALDIGRATTGSGLITLFAVLAKAGLLRRDDDDKDKNAKAMHAAQGLSGTQLNLTALKRWIEGGDLSLTDGDVLADIGFLEPLDSLMTIATLLANDKDLTLTDIGVKSLDGVWKAISNTSAMQTISNIISTVQYHDEENDLPLYFQIPIEIASDSVSGFIPSPVRQLAQATDTTYRDQYRSKNINDQIRAKVANSIPGVRQTLAPKITPLGEDKKYQKPVLNYLNATLNPGNINVYKSSKVVDELNRVYGETDDEKIWPERNAPYSFKLGGEKITLTPDERTQYQRTRGQTTANAMDAVMGTDWYKAMSTADQAEVLNWIGNFANFVAKKEMLEARGQEYGSDTYNKYLSAWMDGTPIEEVVASKHGKLVKAAEETAAAEEIIAEAKIPEESKEEAETMSAEAKRYYAGFLQGGVSDETARKLATEMEGKEASGHEQWRMVYNAAGKEGEKAVTSVMSDDMKRNWELAKDVGVSMDDYIKVRENYLDLDGNGKKKQDEWNATLDSFTFSTSESKDKEIKGTLWQILTGSESTKNNPYDKEAGQKVIDAKAKGGGKSGGDKARIQLPTQKQPWEMRSKPSSGLRITARPQQEAARPSGLRITARAK